MPSSFNLQPSFFSASSQRRALPPFGEPALAYNPPYGRTEDDQLAWLLVRYLHPTSELTHQVVIDTTTGKVMLDFVVTRGRYRAAFVVSEDVGASGAGPAGDAFWQSMVVATGAVDVIYTITGKDVAARMIDALSVVAGWHPELFSPDGLVELASASSPLSGDFSIAGTGAEIRLRYGAAIEDAYGGESFAWPASEREEVVVRRRGAVQATQSSTH